MSYIELINEFWKQNGFMPFSAIDTKLYFYLLHQCHIRGGHNPFQLQTRDIEFNLSITRKQIGESKNRLKHRGLIDFTSGSRKEAPTYTIIGLGEDMFPEETYVETQIETYPETYSETKQKEIPLKEIPPLNPLKKYTPKKNPPTPTKKISPTRTPEELALERLDSLLQEFHDGRHQIWEDRVMKKFGVDSLRPYYESFRNHVISQGKVETVADIREIKSYSVNSFRFFTKANPVGQLREHEDSASGQTFRAYCKWVRGEAGNVAQNLIPMTEKEFDELLGYYGNRHLFEAIQQINEREDITKKYYSLYRLVIKWIENEKKK